MRKVIWYLAALFGLCVGAFLGYIVFIEWLAFSERNAGKISVALALLGGGLAYEGAKKLLPLVPASPK